MAHISADRVKDTTTTTGTGSITLSGTAPSGFRTFASAMATSDTCYYAIVGGAEWEVGLGTLTAATTLARTTVLASSNAGAAVNFSAGSKDVFVTLPAADAVITQPDDSIVLPESAATEAAAPAAGNLKLYTRNMGGKMMPKVIGPSGSNVILQSSTWSGVNRSLVFIVQQATTGTGGGGLWTSAGTVSHPAPSSTAPASSNQMRRTRYANVVTTTNQQLGPRFNVAEFRPFWRGNAAGLGGFFFHTRFIVELYPASTVRLFAGLSATTTGSVCISDTVLNDTCGLWHDTTDPSTGAGALNFVTRNTATTTKQAITLSNAIAAGNSYDFTMYCPPNGSTISWRLHDLVNNVVYTNSTSTTLPTNTAFMQPQVQMSNGTANITVTTSAIGIVSIYAESDT